MNWLNAIVQCFYFDGFSFFGFGYPIGSVGCTKKGLNEYKVDKFSLGVFLNIRESVNDVENNPLNQGKKLEFKVRLTGLSGEKWSYDLAEFTVDLSDKTLYDQFSLCGNCLNYVDLVKACTVNGLVVESPGEYVVKVLVRECGQQLYEVQCVRGLLVDGEGK